MDSGYAGRKGRDVRSDCWVSFTPAASGGRVIQLTSKVAAMYGTSIRNLANEVLHSLRIDHCQIEIDDAGALPFVIGARIEAAARRVSEVSNLSPAEGWLPIFKNTSRYLFIAQNIKHILLYPSLHSDNVTV